MIWMIISILMGMKAILLAIILFSTAAKAQTYRYYFLDIRATGKVGVAVMPEKNLNYGDIDSLVCERSMNDKGREIVKEKIYGSYTELFNRLSAHGLEFVQFAYLPTVGGATQLIGGSMPNNFAVFRKLIIKPS